jgi:hypothetical protein
LSREAVRINLAWSAFLALALACPASVLAFDNNNPPVPRPDQAPKPAVQQPAQPVPAAGRPTWDVNKAIECLDRQVTRTRDGHAKAPNAPTHNCAHYTTDAIDAGFGGVTIQRPHSAKDFGPALIRLGFREYAAKDIKEYKKGDVVVFQAVKGHPDGHMAMYGGKKWVSDFEQEHFNVFKGVREADLSYKIYHYAPPAAGNPGPGAGPNTGPGGIVVNPDPQKDNMPLAPGQGRKILDKRPNGTAVQWNIKLPKEVPHDKGK